MQCSGVLIAWNDQRGFGFIQPVSGGQQIFVHIQAFQERSQRPQVGQPVSFQLELNAQGQQRAANVRCRNSAKNSQSAKYIQKNFPARRRAARVFAIPVFFLIFLLTDVFWRVSAWVGMLYLVFSVFCFVAYAIDKSAAKAGRRRMAESTLLAWGLFGGWPGAIMAQQLLRHKSNKPTFLAKFWISVAVNILAFLLLRSAWL